VLYTGQTSIDGAFYTGEHEAILDQQTFDLVQTRLQQNSATRGNAHRTKMEVLLRGLIYCSACGSAMYPTYSSSKERRYRYYVCLRAQQRTQDYCATKAVSATAVENAVVESIRGVGVHPRVLEGTAQAARRAVTEQTSRFRDELNTVQVRIKNLKSQLARMRQNDQLREASLKEQIVREEAHAAELKRRLRDSERLQLDENELRRTMSSFDALWKAMNIHEQRLLLLQLLDRVGYDGRTSKVTVSFKSAGIKKLCQRGANP
jgi:site-specific DNA recombinase